MNIRQLINQSFCNVLFQQQSLRDVLTVAEKSVKSEQDRRLLQAFTYGMCRWHDRLDVITSLLLNKPMKPKDSDIYGLIILGLYQLIYTSIPTHAIIHETVNAVPRKKAWAKGLVNKLLRRFIDEKETLLAKADLEEEGKYAHPQWLIDEIKQDYPNQWQDILEANNQHPPMFLRVNQQQCDTSTYLQLLEKADIKAEIVSGFPHAIQLVKPVSIHQLPKFADGFCSVQDISGQSIADQLMLKPGLRVLDACAAPGSKTCHILETQPELDNVTAIDIDESRLNRIKDNCNRLQLSTDRVQFITADASEITSWWDQKLFDRILIDAPCSGTGVIRRHPDIKLLRQPTDIDQFVEKQTQLIKSLMPLLKPDGLLIYSTCSILKRETENTLLPKPIQQFLPVQTGSPDGFSCARLDHSIL